MIVDSPCSTISLPFQGKAPFCNSQASSNGAAIPWDREEPQPKGTASGAHAMSRVFEVPVCIPAKPYVGPLHLRFMVGFYWPVSLMRRGRSPAVVAPSLSPDCR